MSTNKKYILSTLVLIVNVITGVLFYISFTYLNSEDSTSSDTEDATDSIQEYSTQMIGSLPIRGSSSMTSHNGDLYVLDSRSLWRIDESDPENSVLVGWSSLLEYSSIASHNGNLYLISIKPRNLNSNLNSNRKLWQIDLNDIENGNTVVGDLPDQLSQPKAMNSHNGVLYVVSSDGQLWKLDPSDPYNKSTNIGDLPDEISFSNAITLRDMTSHNGSLYITDYDDFLWQIDTSDPENGSSFAGDFPYLSNPKAMASHNGILYISGYRSDGKDNLWQINIKDLEKDINFIEGDDIGSFPLLALDSMTSHNGDLYVSGGPIRSPYASNNPILKIDLNNLENSTSIRSAGYDVIVSHNGVMYALNYNQTGLLVLDSDNSDNGNDTIDLSGNSLYIISMASHNGSLYMVPDSNRPQLWQIHLNDTNKDSTLIGDLPDQLSRPKAITSHNRVLYIADRRSSDLWQIDLSNPKNGSVHVGNLPGPGTDAMASLDGALYVMDSENHLWKINLDD